MNSIRNPGRSIKAETEEITFRIPGRRTKFRHGYPLGTLEESHKENTHRLHRSDLIHKIESGVYDDASEDGDDFSSFELGDEEMMDDDFSMENLQLSQISTSSSSAHNHLLGSRTSMIFPLLLVEGETLSSSMYSETKATEKEPSEDPELEYEYEPGISLGQFEFAQEEALLGGNPFIDYEADLQLAAELGKTLLERNKELENVMKQQQSMVEDQSHEIEYLTKQNLALREVNESRLKVYEQLEVSINELEDSNRKLAEESKSDKIRIKSLTLNNDRLESRLEELQRSLEESSHHQNDHRMVPQSERKEERRNSNSSSSGTSSYSDKSCKSSSPEKFWREVNEELILNKEEQINGDEDDPAGIESKDEDIEKVPSPTESSSSDVFSRMGSNSPASSGYSSDQPYHFSLPNEGCKFEDKSTPKKETENYSGFNSPWRMNPSKTTEIKISELQKAFASLDSENAFLKEEIEKSRQERDLDTVQEEVLKIHEVKIGKLCRRCLDTIESPLSQGLKSIQNVAQQVQGDFIHEKSTRKMDGHTEKLEMELCPEGPNISHSHLSAPHKYSSQIRSASPSSLSLQDELMISTSGGISNESGYVSFSGSRKDSSSSASSSINSFIRRKESLSTVVSGRKESLMSRKDSTLSTWSSPEYDLTYSEMIGETSISSGPSSILLSKYTIPEEESLPCRSDVAHYSSGERGELTPESSPFSLIRNKVLSSPVLGDSIFQNKLHQNYKDIFKEMFSILRKAQY